MDATVLIASPIRNRAWILPEFLAALQALEHAAERRCYYFLLNDCADASPAVVRAWAAGRPRTEVEEIHTGVAGWNRYRWPHYDYANLASLRNRILERFLQSHAAYLFSVDSDILVPPHALRYLLAADKPVIAGVIANLPGFSVESFPAHNFLLNDRGRYRQERAVPSAIFRVAITGAVALIRREVIAAGVRYDASVSTEDVGFCTQAERRGFGLWCHGAVRCVHRMDDPGQLAVSRPAARPR